jgi:Ca2+-binding EF-hand superfamily protein
MMKREPKKSETLQVRLPHGMKRDFMRRCEDENRPASDVLRDFIESYLARPVEFLTSERAVMIRRTFVYPTVAAAALLGLAVTLTPQSSQATSLRGDFAAMDADKDGVVVLKEFKRPDDGVIYSMRTGSSEPKPAAKGWRLTKGGDAEVFGRLDGDGDGKLSFQEYRVMRVGAAMAVIRMGDRDADKRLTRAEYVEGSTIPDAALPQMKAKAPDAVVDAAVAGMRKKADDRFERLDVDRDGFLTVEEMTPA